MNKDHELEYLMNPILYDKYTQLSFKQRDAEFLKDKQFYRKRIQQMAKDCSKFKLVKGTQEPPKTLMTAFDAFAKQCIVHFKTCDETECYQEEYKELKSIPEESAAFAEIGELNVSEIDTNLLGNQPDRKIITMDEFVEKKKTKPPKPIHLPKQKQVNVRDEKYRTKGLKKNKSNE